MVLSNNIYPKIRPSWAKEENKFNFYPNFVLKTRLKIKRFLAFLSFIEKVIKFDLTKNCMI